MKLIDMLIQIIHSAKRFIMYVFEYDYSMLEKELFGVSLIDVCGLFLCFYLAKEVVTFCASILGRLFGGLYKQGMGYLSFGIHRMLFRCFCTIRYIWSMPIVTRKRNLLFERVTSRITHQLIKIKNLKL